MTDPENTDDDASAPAQLVDKSVLLAGGNDELVDVWLSIGIVRIRPLTRLEVMRDHGKKSVAQIEAEMIVTAVVEPPFSIEEVKRWQRVSIAGGDIEHLSNEINRISGLSEGAGKEATQRFPDEPDA